MGSLAEATLELRVVRPRWRHLPTVGRLFDEFLVPFAPGEVAYHLAVRRGLRVAELDGVVAGFYLAVDVGASDSLWLDYMAVEPGMRRRGVGRALVADLEQRARSLGYRRLELSVFEWNEAAIRLYETLGFAREDRPDLPRKQRMVKLLDAAPGVDTADRTAVFGSRDQAGVLARGRRALTWLAVRWGQRRRAGPPQRSGKAHVLTAVDRELPRSD